MKTIVMSLCLLSIAVAFGAPNWVFFEDKGFQRGGRAEKEAISSVENRVSQRSLHRRALRGNPLDYEDIPVFPKYIERIENSGAKIRVISKFLNAVSVEADETALSMIIELPFVEHTKPVASFRRDRPFDLHESVPSYGDYGTSWTQNRMIGADRAHSLGLTGDGVLVCITDTGFKLDHLALDSSEVLGAYDFIDDDSIVSFEPGDPSPSESHGTMTWSVIGGYYPGDLIGTAYGVSVLLARTEHYTMESPVEEDYWIAAGEWADSAGADVISVSLGYSDWYTPDSMTGDIAPISIVADILAEHGICCVICSGNHGSAGATSVTVPGDADSVITVGAVDMYGNRLSFSGQGPTADGRIKPELSALGIGVKAASSSGISDFRTSSGTSASTPLVAGLTALMLEARPELAPMDIRTALISTASNNETPNNEIGWGIPDIMAALSYPVGGEAAIPIYTGWNLVSIPLADTITCDAAFPGHIGDIWLWEPDSAAYIEATVIEPGKGYFVLYDCDTLLIINGDTPLNSIDLELSSGWHAIGAVASTNSLGTIASRSTASIHNDFYLFSKDTDQYKQTKQFPPGHGGFLLVTVGGSVRLAE
ncbi:S8 family serine peptidase [bacterium]|nr:S8 family serine peptidase [bacterium]